MGYFAIQLFIFWGNSCLGVLLASQQLPVAFLSAFVGLLFFGIIVSQIRQWTTGVREQFGTMEQEIKRLSRELDEIKSSKPS